VSIRKIKELSQQSHKQEKSLLGRVIEGLKITSIPWNGNRVNNGLDPFSISWENEQKALQEFCLFVKKELYPVFGPLFKVSELATYGEEAILDVLMYMAVNAVTSENGAKGFKGECKKGLSPSPRTIRYRLEKLEFLKVKSAFLKINKKILSLFKKQKIPHRILSLFKKKIKVPVLISIDKSHVLYYGKRKKYACGIQKKRGTHYGYGYASVVVSVAGMRVTLHTMAITEFTNTGEILEKLITEARKYVEIESVLVDREFSNSPCIEKLEELNVTYVTPVIEHRKEFLDSLTPPCMTEMPLGKLYVPIIAIPHPDNSKETLYYATNVDMSDKPLEEIITIYKNRWTVENAFKSQKREFLGKTYSVNFTIRFFLWALATVLYNAWLLCNLCVYADRGVNPSKQERPSITAFLFGIHMKITFLSPLFLDDIPEEF
jgi:hypothetical protein